jgi:hypothetical protein
MDLASLHTDTLGTWPLSTPTHWARQTGGQIISEVLDMSLVKQLKIALTTLFQELGFEL